MLPISLAVMPVSFPGFSSNLNTDTSRVFPRNTSAIMTVPTAAFDKRLIGHVVRYLQLDTTE
jgi:hypothetical protein